MQVLKKSYLYLLLSLLFVVSNVSATNGYFRHGYGIQYRGLAGAGSALYLSPLAVATNPALAAFMHNQIDIGLSIFNPNRQYTVMGNPSGFPGTFPLAVGTVESESNYFPVPEVGLTYALSSDGKNMFGFAIFGNGGMNTDYPVKTFDNPQLQFNPPTGVDLSQLFVSATFSRKIAENHSIGISALLVYQRFQAEGLFAFSGFSKSPDNLTNNDYDNSTGFGVRIGYFGKLNRFIAVGASYQPEINMQEFDKYSGLFAEDGDFNIPANWNAGIAINASETVTIALDVQQVFYSKVNSVGNPMDLQKLFPVLPSGAPNPMFKPLGDPDGAGFGWQDVTTVKMGLQWVMNEKTTLRGGYSIGNQPVEESEVLFNILAPGVIEQHLTLGVSQKLSDKVTLNAGLMHAFSNTVTGKNPLDPAQTIELEMNQFEGDLGISINL